MQLIDAYLVCTKPWAESATLCKHGNACLLFQVETKVSKVQGHSWLHSHFKAGMVHKVRLYIKKYGLNMCKFNKVCFSKNVRVANIPEEKSLLI